MLLFALGWVRFAGDQRPLMNLPFVSGDNLTSFVGRSEFSVVFFPDASGSAFDFANYAISRYRSIKFALSTHEDGKAFNVPFYPCALGFVHGKPYPGTAIQRPVEFTKFCAQMLQSVAAVIRVTTVEQLRLILDDTKSVLMSVDECRPPKNQKRGDATYCVSAQLMRYFGLNVTGGYYVYRGQDRQLLAVTERNYRGYMKTFVESAKSAAIASRPFFAGYFMNERDPAENEKELAILSKLSQNAELRKSFNIGPISGPIAAVFSQTARVDFIPLPMFLVVASQNDGGRWIVTDADKVHDVEYLEALLGRVAAGAEPATVLSSPINESDPMSINHDRYWEIVEGDNVPSVVGFVDQGEQSASLVREVFGSAQGALGNSVRFYVFDASKNDIPSNVQVTNLPTINYYREGKHVAPSRYIGTIAAEDLVKWVREVTEDPLHPESEL